ncbi:MAG: Arsenic transporter [Bryobacterales bacterium]|nr:Arsenic transporter [Bryobacterales bacterium]
MGQAIAFCRLPLPSVATHLVVWTISAVTVLLILIRPGNSPEAVWASAGAALLILSGGISPAGALSAVARGTDVYFFLTGMMILAELARLQGFFDWIAAIAVEQSRGSRTGLFALVYLVGTIVTIFLSNDATAVVLTPAVFAAVKRARARPLPYLLICAFIANAASFVLPISNPANLVLYSSKMPPLAAWLRVFALPSLASVVVTFLILRLVCSADLQGALETAAARPVLAPAGKRAAYGIAGTAFALILASAFNLDLGLPTFLAAIATAALVTLEDPVAPVAIAKDISWTVLPLVAGLFVLVEALNGAGARAVSRQALEHAFASPLSAAFGVAILSNLMNNLPVGLIAAGAIHAAKVSDLLRTAILIGIDLGPNLSVTGSLATILWLVAIRREGENVTFWQFLRS